MAAQTYTFATRPNGPRHIRGILYIPGVPTINAPSNCQQETVDQFLVRYNRSKIDWDSKASRGKFAGLGVPVFADGMQRSPKMVLTGVRGGDWVLPTPEWVAASAGRGQMGRISPGRTYITSATLGQALIAAIAGASAVPSAPASAALPLAPLAPILLPPAAPPANSLSPQSPLPLSRVRHSVLPP
ncbi:hypothetical protein EYC80_007224 [Monilinia laxa]|uniref:Uncharacterized protein n=1 Tax=Monilinia laxa TaxID=61186 RepID=A0A5N6K0Y4_MONLA|nr:hypothetical protein EYC80_007224 [Monilinia laxa]